MFQSRRWTRRGSHARCTTVSVGELCLTLEAERNLHVKEASCLIYQHTSHHLPAPIHIQWALRDQNTLSQISVEHTPVSAFACFDVTPCLLPALLSLHWLNPVSACRCNLLCHIAANTPSCLEPPGIMKHGFRSCSLHL